MLLLPFQVSAIVGIISALTVLPLALYFATEITLSKIATNKYLRVLSLPIKGLWYALTFVYFALLVYLLWIVAAAPFVVTVMYIHDNESVSIKESAIQAYSLFKKYTCVAYLKAAQFETTIL